MLDTTQTKEISIETIKFANEAVAEVGNMFPAQDIGQLADKLEAAIGEELKRRGLEDLAEAVDTCILLFLYAEWAPTEKRARIAQEIPEVYARGLQFCEDFSTR